MPEIKHNFTGGKMNKDLDERIIPNGQYRDAMNVQVSTSDGSDVGVIQNILGNHELTHIVSLPNDALCVGSISDEKTDSLYWFVTGNEKDMILQLKKTIVTPVFVDLTKDVLRFSKHNIITGINVVDDMLFWTDITSEPKKINIKHCIDGTSNIGDEHTKLVNPSQGIFYSSGVDMHEKHITVIRKPPKYPLTLQYETLRDSNKQYTGVVKISDNSTIPSSFIQSSIGPIHNFAFLSTGDTFRTVIETDISGSDNFSLDWKPGTEVILKEYDFDGEPPIIPIDNYRIKGVITNWEYNNFNNANLIVNENGDFSIGGGGGAPSGWFGGGSFATDWNWNGDNIESAKIVHSIAYTKVNSFGGDVEIGNTYKVTFTIGEPRDGVTPLAGRAWVVFIDDNSKFTSLLNTDSTSLAAGTYTETFKVDSSWFPWGFGYGDPNTLCFFCKADVGTGDVFNGTIDNVTVELVDVEQAKVEVKITSISGTPPNVDSVYGDELKYAIDKFNTEDKLFEFKFPRFAYRYKYIDGEYSTFSPFTEIVFIPGSFNYHPSKGYNLGMVNSLKSLTIKDFKNEMPDDVKSIDILYKEEHSPVIYIVDTIKNLNKVDYTITSETIKNGTVPSNQLLRLWDNVPRSALAQDITGNRIIYGNYLQNYDLIDSETGFAYDIKLEPSIVSENHDTGIGKKSIKSLREYQLGVVYVDKYGRETPVLTNSLATIKTSKSSASDINRFKVSINSEGHPINMEYFKFYVKETSGKYYNLAMDRFFDAEDDNIWLSFPSSERDKIVIDDYLILKKGIGASELIKENARYKVLDIKNEAPDSIKREENLLFSKKHTNTGGQELFDDSNLPSEDSTTFTVAYDQIVHNSIANLHNELGSFVGENSDIFYASIHHATEEYATDRYKITALSVDETITLPTKWYFTLEKPFTSEINEFTDSPSGVNVTKILNNTYLNIYKSSVIDSAKFDGRFFVKIYNDDIFRRNIEEEVDEDNVQYRTVSFRKIYSLETSTFVASAALAGNVSFPRYNEIIKPIPSGTGTSVYFDAFKDVDTKTDHIGLSSKVKGGPYENISGFFQSWKGYDRATANMLAGWGSLKGDTDAMQKARNKWRMFDSYFRAFNVEPDGISERVSNMEIHRTNHHDQSFEDVWFIDKGESMGNINRTGDRAGWSPDPVRTSWTSTGLNNWPDSSRIELGFGGIQPVKWEKSYDNINWVDVEGGKHQMYIGKFDKSFFDLEDTNTNYSTTQRDFIKNITVGSQFRFREDPDRNIYTITDVEIINRVRYESLSAPASWENAKDNHASLGSTIAGAQIMGKQGMDIGDVHGEGNVIEQGAASSSGTMQQWDMTYKTSGYLRASNYTKNWRLKLDKRIEWDPVTDTGGIEISGGIPIILSASTAPSGTASGSNFVAVVTLYGLGSNKDILTLGMVLKKYTTGGTEVTLTIPAIVSEIGEFTDSSGVITGYKIFFKTYDGSEGFGSGSSGDIDQIANGEPLAFYHFPMNGLSKNSAKNLNKFRHGVGFNNTNAGTDAVGYNLEFIEPKSSLSEDKAIPPNPAIWETEPKDPVSDLDLYYEMTGLQPIRLDSSNFASIIPIGSTIELENSNNIPTGTTITGVDGETGEITLSTDIQINIPTTSVITSTYTSSP